MQSDQGLHFLFTESMDIEAYIEEQRRSGSNCTNVQSDPSIHCLHYICIRVLSHVK